MINCLIRKIYKLNGLVHNYRNGYAFVYYIGISLYNNVIVEQHRQELKTLSITLEILNVLNLNVGICKIKYLFSSIFY